MQNFSGFGEFYPFYLTQHSNSTCRRLHVVGTSGALLLATLAVVSRQWGWLALAPVWAYGWAWVGHFVFERNRPAAFGHPWWSLRGDLRMCREILTGRIRF